MHTFCVFAVFLSSLHVSIGSINQVEISGLLIRAWQEMALQCMLIGRLDSSQGNGTQDGSLYDVWMQKEITRKVGRHLQVKTVDLDKFGRTCNIQLNVLLTPTKRTNAALKKLVASLGSFARPRWVLFNHDHQPLEEIFAGVDLPFNVRFLVCERVGFRFLILEVYRVAPGQRLRTMPLGEWSAITGFKFDPRSLYERRNNLFGHEIKVLVRNNTPVSTITETDGKIGITGFIGHLWRLLEEKCNFKTRYMVQEDRLQGYRTEHGNWTGMIGKLLKGEADAALDTFSILSLSVTGLEISAQLLRTQYRTYIQKVKQGERVEWDNYLVPFNADLWNAVWWVMVVLSVSLAVSYRVGRTYGSEPLGEPYRFSFYDSFLYVLGAFCQQGQDVTPRSLASRIVYAVSYLTAIIVLNAYSAAIISALTNDETVFPFNNHEGLLEDGTYGLGTERDSALHNHYKVLKGKNLPGSYMYRLINERMDSDPENFVANKLAALARVCSMKYAFMTLESDSPRLKKVAPCDIVPLPFHGTTIALSMPFRPNCPYVGLVDYFIRRIHDVGIMKRALEVTVPHRGDDIWSSVDLNSVSTVLIFLNVGIVLAILVLFLERLSAYVFKRYKHLRIVRWIGLGGPGNPAESSGSGLSRERVKMASSYRRRNLNLKKRFIFALSRQKYD